MMATRYFEKKLIKNCMRWNFKIQQTSKRQEAIDMLTSLKYIEPIKDNKENTISI